MASTATRQATAEDPLRSPSAAATLAALGDAREATLALVGHLSDEQLTEVHSPIMSPLVWDLAHIAAYEDLWLAHRHCGMGLLRGDLAAVYDAFETPRAVRGDAELLGPDEAYAYMADVRGRCAEALSQVGVGDGTICEMVVRHEHQHQETMRQTLALAGLLLEGEPRFEPASGDADDWIEVPGGPFEMGAGPEGFAYDNERPQHIVELPPFQIARLPVPACHMSWHDAQAHAEALGARLPTEAEWEKAAKLGLLAGVGQVWEWTSSRFGPYPGFVAHPYREYSEVFFGGDYYVLRGGSWASSPRVATLTFRNWDHPIRRQIFAGVRLARDVA